MSYWLRRAQPLHHRGGSHGRLALNAYTRSYSTEASLAPRTAATRGRLHGLNQALAAAPTPPTSPERSSRARHTLRALLRECSYLPDPVAKQYLSQHVLSRFRTYGYRAWKHRKEPDFQVRLDAKEREARQTLNLLKRANQGALKPLLRVLFQTYGRIGKHRHELMQPLMPKAASDDIGRAHGGAGDVQGRDHSGGADPIERGNITSADVDGQDAPTRKVDLNPVAEAAKTSTTTTKALPQLTPALYALARSQIRTSPTTMTRPNPRTLKPDIPQLNAKMRPMPKSRVKNMTQKWYATTLDRLLPPLPTQEWLRLRNLAAGRGIQEQLSKRRRPPETSAQGHTSALERVLMRGTFDTPNPTTSDAHTLTPRFMQRVYATVMGQCPRMDWDSKKERWEVTWGTQTLSRAPHSAAP